MTLSSAQEALGDHASALVQVRQARPYITDQRFKKRGRRHSTEFRVAFEGQPETEAVWCAGSAAAMHTLLHPQSGTHRAWSDTCSGMQAEAERAREQSHRLRAATG